MLSILKLWNPANVRAIRNGFVQWIGEAVVGLIPWLAFSLTHGLSRPTDSLALCTPHSGLVPGDLTTGPCRILSDNAYQEVCILAVVISGLALLSIGQFAQGRRKSPRNAFTYFMQLCAIVSLVAGAIFYALITAHLDRGIALWTYAALGVALVSSLCLALQEAIFNEREWLAQREEAVRLQQYLREARRTGTGPTPYLKTLVDPFLD